MSYIPVQVDLKATSRMSCNLSHTQSFLLILLLGILDPYRGILQHAETVRNVLMYLPDDLFDTVSGLSNLQMLDLNYGSNVTKWNIGVLCGGGGMDQLTVLRMDGTDVPDAALVHIPKLPSLVQLHLASCWKVKDILREVLLGPSPGK